MMKVTYNKNLKSNYMLVDLSDHDKMEYDIQMLKNNHIMGFLNTDVLVEDNHIIMRYDITSKQPLSEIMQRKCISSEELRRIVFYILQAIEESKRYLLEENNILLQTEYIYVDCSTYKIGLCYVPDNQKSVREQLITLLSLCPTAMDRDESEAVLLAYNLYSASMKEDFVMDDLLRVLSQSKQVKADTPALGNRDEFKPDEESRIDIIVQNDATRANNSFIKENKHRGLGKLNIFRRFKEKKSEQEIKTIKKQPNDLLMNPAIIERDDEWIKSFEQDDTIESKEEGNLCTQYIASDNYKDNTYRKLKPVSKGDDIMLGYFPFIIGRQQRISDYVLEKDGISRMHARIDREDEDYYITDLNSRNGTKINGIEISGEKKTKISIGDIIKLADIEYKFV